MARGSKESDDDSGKTSTQVDGSALGAASSLPLGPGTVLAGRYRLEEILGQGGSGIVFRAFDVVVNEEVAIKILLPDRAIQRSWIKRLVREVKVARAIRHPNVCRVFEVGHADGYWFVIMELATGGTLRQLLRSSTDSQSTERAVRGRQDRLADARAVCSGLGAIHAVGIVHRDVTPQNVLRMRDGRLMISDFGLAIADQDTTTLHGGTPNYMPPEALRGERSNQRSDVWQLGVMLHEILFNERPVWEQRGPRVFLKSPVGVDAPALDGELARLCADCLETQPELRPTTAVAVAGRLAAAEATPERGWLLRRWLRGWQWFERRRAAFATALGVATLSAIAVRGLQIAERPVLCRGAQVRVAGVWDPAVKATVERAFLRTKKPYAGSAFASVTQALDLFTHLWTGMYTEACEATHVRGDQSTEVLDLRMSCLNERLGEVKALTTVLGDADGDVVQNAVNAVGAIARLDRCADVAQLRAVIKLPESPAQRAKVDELRERIAELKAFYDSGRIVHGLRAAVATTEKADALGYPALQAEAYYRLGVLQSVGDDVKATEQTTERALWLAEGAGHDEIAAESAILLVAMVGERRANVDQAARWFHHAEAILRRMGRHELLQSWLLNNWGIVHSAQGQYSEALSLYQRSLTIKEKFATALDVGRAIGNIAETLHGLGRYEQALVQSDRAIVIVRNEFGSAHPELAVFLNNHGEILNGLHRYADALPVFKEAIEICQGDRDVGSTSFICGFPLTGSGISYLGLRQPEKAVPLLERALSIRQKVATGPVRLGETRFALARALVLAGGNRRRARALASAARTNYAASGGAPERVDEVERWLRGLPGPPPGRARAKL
ncbi:MAG TPA: serine/threonine-protein kinase [Polyangia bacterium]|jgi:tetratricopeptide (TPR) repeat protein|nr:serine/threonine-protein kinase [Polyangia bacterium]